ncbi:MAG: hypothetical protein JO079_06385 [Frankiaceae bacterium]|nr:hypothetical protein [Frankiaceae bacterium]MBV9369011.1 hypothetical protein [Frankiales bacterium]
MATVQPDTVELFFTESKDAATDLGDALKSYRSSVVTVLAVATGAAAFFGFDKSSKGTYYVLALVAYGLAALAAVPILWPQGWMMNPASDFEAALAADPGMIKTKAEYDLAIAYQKAWTNNAKVIRSMSSWFQVTTLLVVAVVVLAGINATVQRPAVPDQPTHIVIDRQG